MDIIADDTQKLSTLNREEETLSDYYQETIDDATRKNKVLTTNKRHGQDSHSRISTREIKEYMDGLQEEAKYNQDKREKKMTESQGQYETFVGLLQEAYKAKFNIECGETVLIQSKRDSWPPEVEVISIIEKIKGIYKNTGKELSALRLDLSQTINISDIGLTALADQFNQDLNNIRNLSTSFYRCDFTDNAFCKLVNHIGGNLEILEQLSLHFSGKEVQAPSTHILSTYISVESFSTLAELIGKNLNTLQHLSLDFWGCTNIFDGGMKTWAGQVIDNVQTIRYISLSFSSCHITDESLKTWGNVIKNNLNSLQHIAMKFYTCKNITDEGLKALFDSLEAKALSSLQHLILRFGPSSSITDQSLIALAQKISHEMHSLQHFSLNFESCGISNKGLAHISEKIFNLKNLRHLSLNFWGCHKIPTGKHVSDTIHHNLKLLQSFYIYTENSR